MTSKEELREEIGSIVKSNPAVVQNYDKESASVRGIPALIDDLTNLTLNYGRECRLDEVERLKEKTTNLVDTKNYVNFRLATLNQDKGDE